MNIIEPAFEAWFHLPQKVDEHGKFEGDPVHPEIFLEQAGRLCYKSEDKITPTSAAKFIKMLDRRGHRAMLEHCVASVKYVCDRGMSHELVRHRIASYAQESTRYCNYNKEKFGNQISVIQPPFLHPEKSDQVWSETVRVIEDAYKRLTDIGEPAQLARSVLPISLKTEVWATYNLREWQHVFSLRCASGAHPQIRELMLKTLGVFQIVVPSMFKGLANVFGLNGERYDDAGVKRLMEMFERIKMENDDASIGKLVEKFELIEKAQ
jgi:thymidylate synthase (FAD)